MNKLFETKKPEPAKEEINSENTEYCLTASNVANRLNVSVKTLTNWYKWQADDSIEKPDEFPRLPSYFQTRSNGPRLWRECDMEQLFAFKQWVPKGRGGVMGAINQQYWRGHTIEPEDD